MFFDNPYDYLHYEYSRIDSKKAQVYSDDFDAYLKKIEGLYSDDQKDLFESDKELFKKLEELSSKLKLPVEEQERNTYAILNRLSKNVIQVMKENNLNILHDIVFGTLPINDLNAFCRIFPNGQMLVVLNQGLIQFIYFMGRVVSSFFSKKDENTSNNTNTFDFSEEVIRLNLKSNIEGHRKFVEALVLYFAYQDMSISKIYYEKDENMSLSGILWDNAELFVVAHEYSHILLDHLSPTREMKKKFMNEDSLLYQVIRNWQDELSADDLALQIVLAYNQKTGTGLFCGYLGIEFAISCLDIIEKACNIKFSETHPSSELRRQSVQKGLQRILPEKYDSILEGSKIIEEIVSYLWNTNKDTIYNLCNKISSISK